MRLDQPKLVIRTSDSIVYRRCRRRWGWSSHLKGNRDQSENATPLWLGSGVHYALEDFHGYNHFGHPSKALVAFAEACRRTPYYSMPADWADALELGVGMMDYYLVWLERRDPYKTLWWNGEPQVEVSFSITLPIEPPPPYTAVVYEGVLDRVAVDEYDSLIMIEYKTAAAFEDRHLDTDTQVSRYAWGGHTLYDRPIGGIIYQQHLKTLPEEPRVLAAGTISTDKRQRTTSKKYQDALINLYGKLEKAPASNIHTLNNLKIFETELSDRYIRRDIAYRNLRQIESEGVKILLETQEMMNPNTPLYPNPTRECARMCPFLMPCIALDSGDDWEELLQSLTVEKQKDYHPWRKYLPLPKAV